MSNKKQGELEAMGNRVVFVCLILAALLEAGAAAIIWFMQDVYERMIVTDSAAAAARGIEFLHRSGIDARIAGIPVAMVILLILLSGNVALITYYLSHSRTREQKAHDEGQRYQHWLSNIPGMSYRCEECYPWSMEVVSDGCEALCGYDREAFEEERVLWGELIHAADLDKVKRSIAEAVEAERRFDIEYRIQTKTAGERWVWDRGIAVVPENGIDLVLDGFITDITDRKAAESLLLQEQGYSKAIVTAALDAVITVDASGKVEVFNPAAQIIFGYSSDDMEGKEYSVLLSTPYLQEYQECFSHYNKTGEIPSQFERREIVCERSDGTEFPAQMSISKLQHQTERKLVCFFRDISVRVTAERDKRELTERLAHVDRLNMLGEMATGIAHEINQPLTAISLFSQAGKRLLASGKKTDLPSVFDRLSEHALRAGEIVERMQKMTEQHVITFETLECNSLLEEVASLAVADARIRDIVIDLDFAEGLSPVSVDRVQIQQVVLNLLRNGMAAMQSVQCRKGDSITLRSRPCDNGDTEISVIDSGGGISSESAEELFKPFSTSRESGLKLGLSISRAIVLSHGGHIDYCSNERGGTTFYFTLPAADPGEKDG